MRDPRRISDSAVLIATLARRLSLLADFLEQPHAGFNPVNGLPSGGLDRALIDAAQPRDWALAHAVVVLRRTDSNDWAHEFTNLDDTPAWPLLGALRGLDPESILAVVYACPPHIRTQVLAAFDKSGAWRLEPDDLPAAMGTVAEFGVEPLVPRFDGPDIAPEEFDALAPAVLEAFSEGGPDGVTAFLQHYIEDQERIHGEHN